MGTDLAKEGTGTHKVRGWVGTEGGAIQWGGRGPRPKRWPSGPGPSHYVPVPPGRALSLCISALSSQNRSVYLKGFAFRMKGKSALPRLFTTPGR